MTDDPKKDRSPNYPKITLEAAVEAARQLHLKIGKAKVAPAVAAGALGYGGMNGAALTKLGAINQYGLIDRERGANIGISQLALRIFHPISARQEQDAKRESALTPRVFNDLFTSGFHMASEDVLSNHLIHSGFTLEGAKRAASVYKANSAYSKLDDNVINDPSPNESQTTGDFDDNKNATYSIPQEIDYRSNDPKFTAEAMEIPTRQQNEIKPLAKYAFQTGDNEAVVSIFGKALSEDDFDSIIEVMTVFKGQFAKKRKKDSTKAQADESQINAV